MKKALQLTADDNVATALEAIEPGDAVEIVLHGAAGPRSVTALEAIPFGFKIASRAMARGATVLKYGHPIAKASSDIAEGALVHVHNVEGNRGRGDLA